MSMIHDFMVYLSTQNGLLALRQITIGYGNWEFAQLDTTVKDQDLISRADLCCFDSHILWEVNKLRKTEPLRQIFC